MSTAKTLRTLSALLVIALAVLIISLTAFITHHTLAPPPPHPTATTADPLASTSPTSAPDAIELTTEPAPFNRLALLAKARERMAAIKDLVVDYRTATLLANLDDPTWNDHYRVALKGPDKIYIEEQNSPLNSKKSWLRIVAYNGTVETDTNTLYSFVSISPNRNADSLSTRDLLFFEANMIQDPVGSDRSHRFASLVLILDNFWTSVHPKIEKIAGHRCEAIDFALGFAQQPEYTVWVDIDRALLPLRYSTHFDRNRKNWNYHHHTRRRPNLRPLVLHSLRTPRHRRRRPRNHQTHRSRRTGEGKLALNSTRTSPTPSSTSGKRCPESTSVSDARLTKPGSSAAAANPDAPWTRSKSPASTLPDRPQSTGPRPINPPQPPLHPFWRHRLGNLHPCPWPSATFPTCAAPPPPNGPLVP